MLCPAETNPAVLTAEEYFNPGSSPTARDIGHPCQLTTKTQRWHRQEAMQTETWPSKFKAQVPEPTNGWTGNRYAVKMYYN